MGRFGGVVREVYDLVDKMAKRKHDMETTRQDVAQYITLKEDQHKMLNQQAVQLQQDKIALKAAHEAELARLQAAHSAELEKVQADRLEEVARLETAHTEDTETINNLRVELDKVEKLLQSHTQPLHGSSEGQQAGLLAALILKNLEGSASQE